MIVLLSQTLVSHYYYFLNIHQALENYLPRPEIKTYSKFMCMDRLAFTLKCDVELLTDKEIPFDMFWSKNGTTLLKTIK